MVTIDDRYLCDGIVHCDNGEDESCLDYRNGTIINYARLVRDNPGNTTLLYGLIRCPTVNEGKEYYIPKENLCDGQVDCPVGSDSSNRAEESICSTNNEPLAGILSKSNDYFVPPCLPGLKNGTNCSVEEIEMFGGVIHRLHVDKTKDKNKTCSTLSGTALIIAVKKGLCKGLDRLSLTTFFNGTALEDYKDDYEIVLASATFSKRMSYLLYNESGDNFQIVFSCNVEDEAYAVSSTKVCDYIEDCPNSEDENNCNNYYCCDDDHICGDVTDMARQTAICDGRFDCTSKNDECGEQCRGKITFRLIETPAYRYIASLIAFFSLLLSSISIGHFFHSVNKNMSLSRLSNDILVALVSVGDFAVGIYMLLVVIYDQYYKEDYCKERQNWLCSSTCSFIGVISTFGNQLSLQSMTLLAVFRLISLKTMLAFTR
eukprot:sb/3464914/